MASRKEVFLLAVIQIILLYGFLSPVYDYFMCVEPDDSIMDTVLICLGWKEKQYICLSAYSLALITLRNCVIQILTVVLYYAKLKMSVPRQSAESCYQGRSDMDGPSLSDTPDPGWKFLRPQVPLSQMSEEEREIEWKYSHLYMLCVYDHHNTSGFIKEVR